MKDDDKKGNVERGQSEKLEVPISQNRTPHPEKNKGAVSGLLNRSVIDPVVEFLVPKGWRKP